MCFQATCAMVNVQMKDRFGKDSDISGWYRQRTGQETDSRGGPATGICKKWVFRDKRKSSFTLKKTKKEKNSRSVMLDKPAMWISNCFSHCPNRVAPYVVSLLPLSLCLTDCPAIGAHTLCPPPAAPPFPPPSFPSWAAQGHGNWAPGCFGEGLSLPLTWTVCQTLCGKEITSVTIPRMYQKVTPKATVSLCQCPLPASELLPLPSACNSRSRI